MVIASRARFANVPTMTIIDDDEVSNLSGNDTIWEVADARLSRRRLVAGGVAVASC